MNRGDGAQARITAFWSMVAPNYEARPGNVPEPDSAEDRAWNEAIARLLPVPPADVLDLGTGTGYLARIAARIGHRVTATDLSAAMLAEARAIAERQQLVDIRFEVRDAVEPGYDFASFDAVTCRHLLWTLRSPVDAFRHWRAMLRPGGRVVAIDAFVVSGDDPQPAPFEDAYGPDTRAELPVMGLEDTSPILDLFREAGFADVTSEELAAVHAASAAPPSVQPWYAIVATRDD